MDPASFAFGAAGAAVLLLKCGRLLTSKYEDFKRADLSIAEEYLLLSDHWFKMEAQIDLLGTVWPDLPGGLQVHYNQIMSVLRSKIQRCVDQLDRLTPVQLRSKEANNKEATGRSAKTYEVQTYIKTNYHGSLTRARFTVKAKKAIEMSLSEIQKWQVTFQLSWSQLAQVKSARLDACLSTVQGSVSVKALQEMRDMLKSEQSSESHGNTVFLPRESVASTPSFSIDYSSLVYLGTGASGRSVISDRRDIEMPPDLKTQLQDIRNIARLMRIPHPTISGVPTCEGVIKHFKHGDEGALIALELLFTLPNGSTNIRSLRHMLIESDQRISLDRRFGLAKQISRSVMAIHTWQFVHKSIRPDNIIVVQTPAAGQVGYLMGYERFRQVDGVSILKRGDDFWDKNIYRHPNRQGIRPNEDYMMQHDIYSLGVVLLEIGLWQSFVQWQTPDLFRRDASTSTATPSSAISIAEALSDRDSRRRAFTIKKEMIRAAASLLPGKMGQRYANVVVSCLTCLDSENKLFGDERELLDDDGMLVGVRYIEKILLELEEISL